MFCEPLLVMSFKDLKTGTAVDDIITKVINTHIENTPDPE